MGQYITVEGVQRMRRILGMAVLSLSLTSAVFADPKKDLTISTYDNCDPLDPGWLPTGGCLLKPGDGDVTLSQFMMLLTSPFYLSVVGHPSWRMEPSYLSIDFGKTVEIENEGGRQHTFTEVQNFGGGFIPSLSPNTQPAPECQRNPPVIQPGASTEVKNLNVGEHKFQCCIHPWMRAVVNVKQSTTGKDKK